MVATTREANVFDLTNAIGRGEHVRALEILARMFSTKEKDAGQAMRLLGMLLWQTRGHAVHDGPRAARVPTTGPAR